MLLGGALLFTLKRTPAFYELASIPEGDARRQLSTDCQKKAVDLWSMFGSSDAVWDAAFTTTQVNSYFQEDFEVLGGEKNLPEGFSDPRISLDDGSLRFACRYGKGFWSSVVSVELKIWLVANEMNTVGVEIVSLKCGAVAVSPRWMLDPLRELARKWNADLAWYRREGNPVAILRLQSNQMRPTFQIKRLDIQKDQLVVVGHSQGPSSRIAPTVVSSLPNQRN